MARAATKRHKGAKQAARPGQRVAPTGKRRRDPTLEQQLFFGRIRSKTKWVFALLAAVFALSFAFLGVGSGSSGLSDFLNGTVHIFGGGGGPSAKGLEKKIAKHPTDLSLRTELVGVYDKTANYDGSIATLKDYLKRKPKDISALETLSGEYSKKVQQLQGEAQNSQQPAPPVAILNEYTFASPATPIGQALASVVDPRVSVQSLQQGQTQLLQKQAIQQTAKQVAVDLRLSALQPDQSSVFLKAAQDAQQGGATLPALALYTQFLKRYPSDPLVPDVRRRIQQLEHPSQSSGVPANIANAVPTTPGG